MTHSVPAGETLAPRVAVVILNWRRPEDTLACLRSVLALDYDELDVMVCDNASGDGSLETIAAGVREMLPAANAARGGSPWACADVAPAKMPPVAKGTDNRLWIAGTGRNGGYAFGNNVGIRLALLAPDVAFVWILNNDTEVAPDALTLLVARMREDPAIGLCGATVRYLERRGEVQSLGGGRFRALRTRCEQIGEHLPADAPVDRARIETQMSYVNGACVLVRRAMIDQVGLMDEGYFLYWEELDWATRMRARGRFRVGFCPEAVVYHRVGAATGSRDDAPASPAATYWMTRSRLRYLRLHRPLLLAFAYPLLVKAAAREARAGRRARAVTMLRAVFGMAPPS